MTRKPILAIDLDGTLHQYTSGGSYKPDTITGEPVAGAVEFCWAASEFFEVQVFSTRNSNLAARLAIKRWLKRYGFPEMLLPATKPPATIFLDDRAICFQGKFPALEELLSFQPWYAAKMNSNLKE